METNGLEDGTRQVLREPVSQGILSSLRDLPFLGAGNQGLASLANGCRAFGTESDGCRGVSTEIHAYRAFGNKVWLVMAVVLRREQR